MLGNSFKYDHITYHPLYVVTDDYILLQYCDNKQLYNNRNYERSGNNHIN